MFSVILLPAHPASFAHIFFSWMQSFYFRESQDAIVLTLLNIQLININITPERGTAGKQSSKLAY